MEPGQGDEHVSSDELERMREEVEAILAASTLLLARMQALLDAAHGVERGGSAAGTEPDNQDPELPGRRQTCSAAPRIPFGI
jgi:hypothetical protein